MPHLINTNEAAKRLSVAPKTIRKWVKAGLIPVTTLPGNNLRFDEAIVDNWVKNRTTRARHYSSKIS